ncbi:hypothetical protein ACVOMT_11825 [Sphingomonas panni]
MPPFFLRATLPIMITLSAIASAQEHPTAGIRRLSDDSVAGRALPLQIGGRVVTGGEGASRYRRQWPGSYFEGAFRGKAVDLVVGPGDVSLRVAVDGAAPVALVRPAPGRYRVAAPSAGQHRIRVDVVSEITGRTDRVRRSLCAGRYDAAAGTRDPAPRDRVHRRFAHGRLWQYFHQPRL